MNVAEEKELTLRDLIRIFDRRRNVFIATASVVFLLSIVACVVMTRRFQASGIVELQKSSGDSLDLGSLMGGEEGGDTADSLTVNLDLQTQTEILQSDALILKVARDLNLEHNRDFQSHFSIIGTAIGLLTPKGIPDKEGASLEDSPMRVRRVTKTFRKHLEVKVVPGTRLIEVNYSNPDPKVAAEVVNHLMQALIDYTFQAKYNAMNQVSTWLSGQLGTLRQTSEDLQARVVQLQKDTGLFGVGGTDLEGKPIIFSPVLDRLQEATAQLSQAELNRILKESVYQVARTGDAELISQLSGTSMAGSSSQGVTNSLEVIQNLRTQEATLKAQIADDASQFGPNYPRLVEEKARLKGIDTAIADEVGRIAERAKNDYEIAQKAEDGSRKTYEDDRAAADKLNDKAIEYALMSKEADESQELYQDLLKRLKEAGILEGLHSSNLMILDQARSPAVPSTPRIPMLLGLGIISGLFLGAGTSIAADAIDNKVRGVEEIEAVGLPVIGLLPKVKTEEMLTSLTATGSKDSTYAEAVRSLRSTVLLSHSQAPPKILLITSGSPGEGKSTVALNLAGSLAQQGKSVLLLEVDLRRPVLKTRLGITEATGLSTILTDQKAAIKTVTIPEYPYLNILPAGPIPPYPAELIGSVRMRELVAAWAREYDFVVLDCPPILPVTDTRLLMELADASILLARSGVTTRVALQRAYKIIAPFAKNPSVPAIGIVLNAISVHSAGYYGYYGYYGGDKYEYRSGGDDNEGI